MSLTIWIYLRYDEDVTNNMIYLRYDEDVTKDDGCIKIKPPDGLEKEHIV